MKKTVLGFVPVCTLALVAFPLHAEQLKAKASMLSQQDAAALRGKRVAVTQHLPSLALFWPHPPSGDFRDNGVPDPALVVRTELSEILRDEFGATVLPTDEMLSVPTKSTDLIEMHRDRDYVLSVRHTGSILAPSPGGYMIGNFLDMQLIETKSGRVLSKGWCRASTYKHPSSPSLDELLENRAELTKRILVSLSWRCTRQFATKGLGLAEDRAPAIPLEHVDPLAGRPITTVLGARRAPRAESAEGAEATPPPKD